MIDTGKGSNIILPELLAPAGGMKQLIAAVENGADAVYLGGKLFNARQNADNFNNDELKEAINYAHLRGVKIYIALNILISDSEMGEAIEYAGLLYQMGADALIVQDLGFANRVKTLMPDFPLHFSTQATIYNGEGIKIAEKLGAERAVLARELSIDEIQNIAVNTRLDMEVFVHGALCQSYSGQCLLSSMIGGRSGNRGLCAQPCRLPYTINGGKEQGGYLLSPKDLCLVGHLEKLATTGVKSLKIEGRMKSPEYVAIVTGVYRKYLDLLKWDLNNIIDSEDIYKLNQIYSRGGFTTGYLFSNPGRDIITEGRPKHWGTYLGKVTGYNQGKKHVDILLEAGLSMGDGIEIVNEKLPGNIVTRMQKSGKSVVRGEKGDLITVGYIEGPVKTGEKVYKITDKELNKIASESFSGKIIKKVPLAAYAKAYLWEPLSISLKDSQGNVVRTVGSKQAEPAINRPLTKEVVEAQLKKTGATPFFIEEYEIEIGEGISVPLSEINEVRRKAIDDMTRIRIEGPLRLPYKAHFVESNDTMGEEQQVRLTAFMHRWPGIETVKNIKVERVYLPFSPEMDRDKIEAINTLKERSIKVYISIPPITKGKMDIILRAKSKSLKNLGIDGLLLGNPGHIEMFKNSGLPLMGDYSFNIYNSESVGVAKKLGLNGVTLSHELALPALKNFRNFGLELELTVYGRIPVFISEHCPIEAWNFSSKNHTHCGLCQKRDFYMTDRKGAKFPVLGDPVSCKTTLLNKDIFNRPEYIEELRHSCCTNFRMYFYEECPALIQREVERFNSFISSCTCALPGLEV